MHFKQVFIGRNISFVSQRASVKRYAIERASRNPDITNPVQQPRIVA
jgi:hypothetical protein